MILDFLCGLLLALLPEDYRRRWLPDWHGSLRNSAMASGILQLLFSLALLLLRYPKFIREQMAAIDASIFLGAMGVGGYTALRGFGIVLLFAYLLTPVSLLLIYFAFEGVIRTTAAVATGEVVGSLPVLLLERTESLVRGWREERRQGKRIPDLVSAAVEGSGYDLAVASCRAKPNWSESMTVSYHDELYEVSDYLEAAPPRRHVYLLRRAPQHKVVRGLDQYDPEEVLKKQT